MRRGRRRWSGTHLVYVNTLMVQEVLALPEWEGVLTVDDRVLDEDAS